MFARETTGRVRNRRGAYLSGVVAARQFFCRSAGRRRAKFAAVPTNNSISSKSGLAIALKMRPVRLERFRFSCSHAVAAMPDVVRALIGHEEAEGRRHQLADVVECARTRRA